MINDGCRAVASHDNDQCAMSLITRPPFVAHLGFEFERYWRQHIPADFGIPKLKEIKKHSEMSRSLPAAIPMKARGKSKGNRSVRCIPGGNEAIWDDELHTALIEGTLF